MFSGRSLRLTKTASNATVAGQVAVITGAGRGIGRAIALKLAELGAHTVLCGRSREALEQTAAVIQSSGRQSSENSSEKSSENNSVKSSVIECDVTDLHSVETLAEHVERTFHRIDILVNNAGIGGAGGPLHRLPPDDWERVLNTNLRGVYYCIRCLAPLMIKTRSGHIINISSLAGKNALPNGAAYAASKWGLNGLTYSRAEELRSHNIRVSVTCPGSVTTELRPHPVKHADTMLTASP